MDTESHIQQQNTEQNQESTLLFGTNNFEDTNFTAGQKRTCSNRLMEDPSVYGSGALEENIGSETSDLNNSKRFKLITPDITSDKDLVPSVFSPVSESNSNYDDDYFDEEAEEASPPLLSPCIEEWLMTFNTWPEDYKSQALNKLVKICPSNHLKSLMDKIRPQFQRDFISMLPKEISIHILSYLSPRDLLICSRTCKTWHALCDDVILWRDKCQDSDIDEPSREIRMTGRSPIKVNNPWKQVYVMKNRIDWNWRNVELKNSSRLKILKGHDDHVVTCLQFCDDKVVSGSDDTTLRIWCAITGECLKTLQGHTGGVWCSEFNGSIIVSGSTDRSLRVWRADWGDCQHVLSGHSSTVRCVALHGEKVVSGSRDTSLRVWSVKTGRCINVLQGHVGAVRCVQFDGTYVVSGAYDFLVKVWNPIEGSCLYTLQGHTNRVYSLLFDGVHVVSGSLDTSIRVWDVKTGQCKHTLVGHQSLTSAMELKGDILVSGNADSTVKVWDVKKGYCMHTLHGLNKHMSAVTSLQFTDNFVVTSSDDGSVKLWDIKTGVFIRDLVCLDGGGNGGVVWRVKCNERKLVCAVGSRNGIEDTKLLVLDFDCPPTTTSSGLVAD